MCVEITSVTPNLVCLDSTFEIALMGSGFNNTRDESAVRCRFRTDSGETYGEFTAKREREREREREGREEGEREREGRGGGIKEREWECVCMYDCV